jgi:hypothetical protein
MPRRADAPSSPSPSRGRRRARPRFSAPKGASPDRGSSGRASRRGERGSSLRTQGRASRPAARDTPRGPPPPGPGPPPPPRDPSLRVVRPGVGPHHQAGDQPPGRQGLEVRGHGAVLQHHRRPGGTCPRHQRISSTWAGAVRSMSRSPPGPICRGSTPVMRPRRGRRAGLQARAEKPHQGTLPSGTRHQNPLGPFPPKPSSRSSTPHPPTDHHYRGQGTNLHEVSFPGDRNAFRLLKAVLRRVTRCYISLGGPPMPPSPHKEVHNHDPSPAQPVHPRATDPSALRPAALHGGAFLLPHRGGPLHQGPGPTGLQGKLPDGAFRPGDQRPHDRRGGGLYRA